MRAGKGSLMSKGDMRDAYKLIPARPRDYRLQGFFWYDSIFIETQQIFGASTSVDNFDTVAKTLQLLARLESKIPKYLVQQTLDDTACVGPRTQGSARSLHTTTVPRGLQSSEHQPSSRLPKEREGFH